MEFNFYDQYKNYPNVELLKILEQPENYQRAAVEAALLVLQERQVSEQERVEVTNQLEAVQQQAQVKQEKFDRIRTMLLNFFEPLLPPGKKVHPVKWLNLLLLVVVYQYLIALIVRIKVGFFFSFDLFTFYGLIYFIVVHIDIAYLVYIPLAFYLMYKRRPWGWIILFVHFLFTLITQLSQSYLLFAYLSVHHANVTMYFISVGFKVALLYFLWRKEVTDYFNVSSKVKKDTALMTLIGAPISIVFLYMVFT